jgi:hypothetical protein
MASSQGIQRQNLSAGMKLLMATGLIVRTRTTRMSAKQPCLYALGWKPIDDRGKSYDDGICPGKAPPNGWVNWVAPVDWKAFIKDVRAKAKGRGVADRARQRVLSALPPSDPTTGGASEQSTGGGKIGRR